MPYKIHYQNSAFVVRAVRTFATKSNERYRGSYQTHQFIGQAAFTQSLLDKQNGFIFLLEYSSKTDSGGKGYSPYAIGDSTPPPEPIEGTIWALSMYRQIETAEIGVTQSFVLHHLWKLPNPVEVGVPTKHSRGRWVSFDHVASLLQHQIARLPGRLELVGEGLSSRNMVSTVRSVLGCGQEAPHERVSPTCSVLGCGQDAPHAVVYHTLTHPVCDDHRRTYPLDLRSEASQRHAQNFRELLGMSFVPGMFQFRQVANGPVIPLGVGDTGNLVRSENTLFLRYRGIRENLLAIHHECSGDQAYCLSDQGRIYSLEEYPGLASRLRDRFPAIQWVQTGGTPLSPL